MNVRISFGNEFKHNYLILAITVPFERFIKYVTVVLWFIMYVILSFIGTKRICNAIAAIRNLSTSKIRTKERCINSKKGTY